MKRTNDTRHVPWALCVLALAVVPRPAHADCPVVSISSDNAFIARVDPTLTAAHGALYAAKSYNLMQEGPVLVDANGVPHPYWGDGPWRSEEERSHFFATLLINHGIVAPNPPLRQNAVGAWEYDPDALLFSSSFHRSWDGYGYGPLALDVATFACQSVDPATGHPACRSDVWIPSFPTFGSGLGSGVLDGFPNPDTGAEFRPIWDAFKDPDWQIRYACRALADTTGVVALARVIVHENWHATAEPKHLDGTRTVGYSGPADNSCKGVADRCDTFIWGATSSARMYAGLAKQQYEGVGSYQLDQEFMCDLVEFGASGLPFQTKLAAQTQFEARASQSRFVNPELADRDGNPATADSGQLPFTCGVPASILSVAANGTATCPGTGQLRCDVDADCDDGDASTNDSCVSLCCTNIVVK